MLNQRNIMRNYCDDGYGDTVIISQTEELLHKAAFLLKDVAPDSYQFLQREYEQR